MFKTSFEFLSFGIRICFDFRNSKFKFFHKMAINQGAHI